MAALDPAAVESRDDFVSFVRTLSEADVSGWENPETARYLESLAAWVNDWPQALEPTWSNFAKAIVAGTIYE